MKLLSVKIDSKQVNKILGNSVSYSYGFLDGVDIQQIEFNKDLGEFVTEALYKYIDSKARMNPEELHHVYEWGQTGVPSARLFQFSSKSSKRVITFTGKFLKSKSVSDTSEVPFTDKANVMENSIDIVIEPKDSDLLAFQSNGETFFTTKSIYIENPGGDAVAGSFGRTVEDFFSNYLTNAFMKPFIDKLSNPVEYTRDFAAGTKNGRSTGVKAGKKYLNTGVVIE